MDPETLFGLALGLTPPWQVRRIEFSTETARLDIYLDFPRGATFRCPACGAAEAKAYDTAEEVWRHLNFFQYEAYLHARAPRVQCPGACGIKTVEAHGGLTAQVTEVACDMSPAFIAGVQAQCPSAQMTFDKFHLLTLLNEAVDQVRREEQQSCPELKRSRYVWLTNPPNLTAAQQATLGRLTDRKLKTVRAYHLRIIGVVEARLMRGRA